MHSKAPLERVLPAALRPVPLPTASASGVPRRPYLSPSSPSTVNSDSTMILAHLIWDREVCRCGREQGPCCQHKVAGASPTGRLKSEYASRHMGRHRWRRSYDLPLRAEVCTTSSASSPFLTGPSLPRTPFIRNVLG